MKRDIPFGFVFKYCLLFLKHEMHFMKLISVIFMNTSFHIYGYIETHLNHRPT